LPARIGTRYEVLSLLASGGMADVYVARDVELRRRVAVKVLRDTGGTARFRAEARTLARLRHPSLVAVLDLGEDDGRPYLVLELVDGTTLAQRVRGGLDPGEVARIAEQVAGALAYVHAAGVVHRDVSPANVLLSHDGRAHLADFGIARLVEDHPTMTLAGETLGTVPYLAPEQVSSQPVGPPADVYSLGLVLLEALTGERAFAGSVDETAVARLHRDPAVPPTLPAAWRELLTAMTAREPAARPSAADVQSRLASLAEAVADVTRPLTVPLSLPLNPTGTAERYPFALRLPRRLTPQLWAGLLVLVAILLIATWPSGDRSSTPRVPAGVPTSVVDELQDLHDAVAGR
jgi:eukaryotic-like serine/threonine-protein kinase